MINKLHGRVFSGGLFNYSFHAHMTPFGSQIKRSRLWHLAISHSTASEQIFARTLLHRDAREVFAVGALRGEVDKQSLLTMDFFALFKLSRTNDDT